MQTYTEQEVKHIKQSLFTSYHILKSIADLTGQNFCVYGKFGK